MAEKKKSYTDDVASSRRLPSSDELSKAAYDADKTAELVKKYRLSAVELSQLIDRLPVAPVPW